MMMLDFLARSSSDLGLSAQVLNIIHCMYVCTYVCMGFFTFQAYCMYGAYVVQLFLFVIFVVRIFHFLYEFEYSFLIVVVLVEVVVLVVVIVVVVVVWVVKEGGCSDSGSNAWRSRRNK